MNALLRTPVLRGRPPTGDADAVVTVAWPSDELTPHECDARCRPRPRPGPSCPDLDRAGPRLRALGLDLPGHPGRGRVPAAADLRRAAVRRRRGGARPGAAAAARTGCAPRRPA